MITDGYVLSRALGQSFARVYPRDLIPFQLKPYEKVIVVKTDHHDRLGKHLVCLYVNSPLVDYFDSYGMPIFIVKSFGLWNSTPLEKCRILVAIKIGIRPCAHSTVCITCFRDKRERKRFENGCYSFPRPILLIEIATLLAG